MEVELGVDYMCCSTYHVLCAASCYAQLNLPTL
jgi:hypothetical protein